MDIFVVAAECATAGDHFVEHGAEREDIRSRIRGFPLRLFGRHVGGGAEDRPFLGLRALSRRDRSVGARRSSIGSKSTDSVNFARPKSRTFDRPLVADHDVGRLEVAMKDAGGVGGRQARRRSEPRTSARPRASACPARSACASDWPATYSIAMKSTPCVLPDVIDRDDVRMIQGGGGSRLLDEALPALAVGRAISVGAA